MKTGVQDADDLAGVVGVFLVRGDISMAVSTVGVGIGVGIVWDGGIIAGVKGGLTTGGMGYG